jgi:hypothetical protein
MRNGSSPALAFVVAWLAAAALASASRADDNWTVTASTETRYFNWDGNLGFFLPGNGNRASGEQLYAPYALGIIGRPNDDFKIDLVARGGWVLARQFTEGLSGQVDTATDSAVGGTVTYYGWNGIQPFISLNMNLPTGETVLRGASLNARMNPDLVDIATFGEGFNIGPTVGFTLPLTSNFILTTSAGYTWRNSFDQDGVGSRTDFIEVPNFPFPPFFVPVEVPIPVVNSLDPAEVFTVTGGLNYQVGQLQLSLSGTYSAETETMENGSALLESGNRYFATGEVSYAWTGGGVTLLNASATHTGKNDVRFANFTQIDCPPPGQGSFCNQVTQAQSLQKEAFNTNSDFFRVGVEHRFVIGQLSIGPTASFLLREANGYAPGTAQFIPEARRWAAGAVMSAPLTDKVTLVARGDHIWLREGGRPFGCISQDGPGVTSLLLVGAGGPVCLPGGAQDTISRDDWQGMVGLNVQF